MPKRSCETVLPTGGAEGGWYDEAKIGQTCWLLSTPASLPSTNSGTGKAPRPPELRTHWVSWRRTSYVIAWNKQAAKHRLNRYWLLGSDKTRQLHVYFRGEGYCQYQYPLLVDFFVITCTVVLIRALCQTE